MSYTKIAKPTDTTYTRVNPVGREQYDQSDVTFDSSTVFYDGINQAAYTNVSKPAGDTWNDMSMTWANNLNTWDNVIYTRVSKPT